MLAQNFKTASDLKITEDQKVALIKTLVLLETGKLHHESQPSRTFDEDQGAFTGHFNMAFWNAKASCGTVCCIGGTAEALGGVGLGNNNRQVNPALHDLFIPGGTICWEDITPSQAATALRSYLSTGAARWDLAVAS